MTPQLPHSGSAHAETPIHLKVEQGSSAVEMSMLTVEPVPVEVAQGF